jgi:hypothetical protein
MTAGAVPGALAHCLPSGPSARDHHLGLLTALARVGVRLGASPSALEAANSNISAFDFPAPKVTRECPTQATLSVATNLLSGGRGGAPTGFKSRSFIGSHDEQAKTRCYERAYVSVGGLADLGTVMVHLSCRQCSLVAFAISASLQPAAAVIGVARGRIRRCQGRIPRPARGLPRWRTPGRC